MAGGQVAGENGRNGKYGNDGRVRGCERLKREVWPQERRLGHR